jgi:hypothetical protein
MGFEGWGHYFEGPFSSTEALKSMPGVYIVWCYIQRQWKILDVGDALNILECLKNHKSMDCWKEHCAGKLFYSASYLTNQGTMRKLIIAALASPPSSPCTPRNGQEKNNDK